jgi:hypothetical protein
VARWWRRREGLDVAGAAGDDEATVAYAREEQGRIVFDTGGP